MRDSAGLRLAPAFDINPNPEPAARQTLVGGYTDRDGYADALMKYAASFGLDQGDPADIIGRIRAVGPRWPQVATANGVRTKELELMVDAFSTDVFPPSPR